MSLPPQSPFAAEQERPDAPPPAKPSRLYSLLDFGLTILIIFGLIFLSLNFSAYYLQVKFIFSNLISPAVTTEPLVAPAAAPTLETPELEPTEPTNSLLAILPATDFPAPPNDYLFIPSLQIAAPIQNLESLNLQAANWLVLEGLIQKALERGVALFPGSTKPGELGNAVLTGHSSYYPFAPGDYKEVFALLPQIQPGAAIIVWQGEKKYTYQVTAKYEVQPAEVAVLEPTLDERLTLITCTPIGTTLRRLVVEARPTLSQNFLPWH